MMFRELLFRFGWMLEISGFRLGVVISRALHSTILPEFESFERAISDLNSATKSLLRGVERFTLVAIFRSLPGIPTLFLLSSIMSS